jgi:hypothetical protein
MEVILTPGARALLHSKIDDPATIEFIAKAMSYEGSLSYRQAKALNKRFPFVGPVTYMQSGQLGFQFLIAEEKVMLFIPPASEYDFHEEFLKKERSTCTQLQIE